MALNKQITISSVTTDARGLHITTSEGRGMVYGSKQELKDAVQQAVDTIAENLIVLAVGQQMKTDSNLDSLQDIVGVTVEVDMRASNASGTVARIVP